MADHFVDGVNGSNANSGHTMDLPWLTVEYAVESGGLTAGDIVWVRRNVAESITTSDVAPAYDATWSSPIQIIGCPRASVAITSSDWTNGSNTVTIDDGGMDREKHQTRLITAPDGRNYMITRVVSATSIMIECEYPSTTVTNQAATIVADEDYDLFSGVTDGSTYTKAIWRADADDMPYIDFGSGAYQLYCNGADSWIWKNIEFRNGTDAYGTVQISGSGRYTIFSHCLFQQTQNSVCLSVQSTSSCIAEYCTFEGDYNAPDTGTSQRGIQGTYDQGGTMYISHCAVYNFCDSGLAYIYGILKDVNVGVELPNGDDDVVVHDTSWTGFNVKLGGTNGYFDYQGTQYGFYAYIENYQKVLGDHRTFTWQGYSDRVTLTTGTTPNKKLSDDVVCITPNRDYVKINYPALATKILEHRVWADTTSKSYKYWIYNGMSAVINDTTAKDNLFLKVTYISAYDDTSEYYYTETYSTQIDIAAAGSASDWDYLEVTGIQPAVASWVILEIYQSMYSAAGTIHIDPALVIS